MNEITFESLGLNEALLSTLRTEGYTEPTPIQAESIPSLLEGRDLLGCAQTGTGKTAAFALPIIQRLSLKAAKREPRKVRALVVAPTRELAAQIDASLAAYGRRSNLTRACVYGGVSKVPQVRAVARGVDVLVATPGRLLDLHGDGAVRLDGVEILVLDEADRMLDMGFIHDVKRIIALVPKARQTMLFSATMPDGIKGLAASILDNPVQVAVAPEQMTVDLIEQKVMHVEKENKKALLVWLLKGEAVARAIVFAKTKHGANRLAESLSKEGIHSDAIHANKSQSQRTRTMDAFRDGKLRVLVATDLAARGIDVDAISHVFNFDLPHEPETYVHRIGRTARAGAAGMAVTFCDVEERPLLRAIERLIGRRVPVELDHPYAVEVRPDEPLRAQGNRRPGAERGAGKRWGGPQKQPSGRFGRRDDAPFGTGFAPRSSGFTGKPTGPRSSSGSGRWGSARPAPNPQAPRYGRFGLGEGDGPSRRRRGA